jgi:predicted DNA-binding protein YlxM (UPF0122 family)
MGTVNTNPQTFRFIAQYCKTAKQRKGKTEIKIITHYRERLIITDCMENAHKLAEHYKDKKEEVRIYYDLTPEQIPLASKAIAKRTILNSYAKQATDFQYRLLCDLSRDKPITADSFDLISVAQLALLQAIFDGVGTIYDAYKAGYKAVNTYIIASRSIRISATAFKTVYLEDINGDIVSISKDIATIVNGDNPYTAHDFDFTENENNQELAEAISTACQTLLTARRRQVIIYTARGLSYRQIGNIMNINYITVRDHIKKASTILTDYLRINKPNIIPDKFKTNHAEKTVEISIEKTEKPVAITINANFVRQNEKPLTDAEKAEREHKLKQFLFNFIKI